MSSVYFDHFTLILYIMIGMIGGVCIKLANSNKTITGAGLSKTEFQFYGLFIFLFTSFAVVRQVSYEIGGTDAQRYIELFENVLKYPERFADQEQLFLYLNIGVRYLTDDYHIYFLLVYGFITFAYCYFIRTFCPKDVSYIPFLLLIWPYLKGFNTIRSSLAIAFFLVGLVMLKKERTWLSVILIIATFFIHRMSLLYIPFLIFYRLFYKYISQINGVRIYVFFAIYMVLGYWAATWMQEFVVASQLVFSGSSDEWYLTQSLNSSLFSRWPMMFPYLLLLLSILFFSKKLPDSEVINYLKIFVFFDILMMIPSLIFNMWRANEYLYVARLVMWGVLINVFLHKFHPMTRPFLQIGIFIGFLLWLVFRIYQEYEETSIMPYVLDLF